MAFLPVSGIASNYRDFKNNWLKAFVPGSTTTPKVMATDATGATTVDKFELDKDGFIVTAGDALIIPYIDGRYDLWLFPTEAEADANDTINAKRFAIDQAGSDNLFTIIKKPLEEIILTAAQTTVTFTTINVKKSNIYLTDLSGDRGRLFKDTDYTETSTLVIELTNSQPAGTKCIADQQELETVATDSSDNVKNFATLAAAIADTEVEIGDALNIAERTLNKEGGGMWDAVSLASVTVSAGAPAVGNIVASTGGQVPAIAFELRDSANADQRQNGAFGDGTNNDEPAIADAITEHSTDNADLLQTSGDYRVNTTLSIPTDLTYYGNGFESVTKKGVNGAIISLAHRAHLRNLSLDGNFASFTGVGVTIPFSAEFDGFQVIDSCKIHGTESFCIEYVSGAAGSGFGSRVLNCDFLVKDSGTDNIVAVKWGVDPTNLHGNRSIIGCVAGSGPLVDATSADNGFVIGNTTGGSSTAGIIYSAATAKVIAIANRMAAPADLDINGKSNIYSNNVGPGDLVIQGDLIDSVVTDNVCGNITLQLGAKNNFVHGNAVSGAVIDDSGSVGTEANHVYIPRTAYTPVLTGATTDPVIGNGSLTGNFFRNGRSVTANVKLQIGTTTTLGSGEWEFTLPFIPLDIAIGTALLFDSGTIFKVGIVKTTATINKAIVIADSEVQSVRSSSPFAWADGDTLEFTITYTI